MSREQRPRSLLENAGVVALVALLLVLLYREVTLIPSIDDADRRSAFEDIYAIGGWGHQGSGAGSTLEATVLYRAYLQEFLARHKIRSVVDAGCGDWQFSQAIDWQGIDYLGVDIVASLIETNQRRFGGAKVRFAVADIVRDPLPAADLLIIKDVLMHLSNADIARVLVQLPRYRHVLIVNDVDPVSLSAESGDVQSGGYRPIDLTRPPHALPAAKALVWQVGSVTKLVLHLQKKG